ncbi:hypothetical protein PHYBOEH_005290 [Phytophthora boehmeriae]|uniref:Uncharacterized protein n=1 Tax=Phytophthora boehmeriae TaxID=109152 RepID=A0A8T1WMA4_9STRA|nr:hypothetical protein PHYBOEH_005290 [Phytophthora boehmeriae]
MSILSAERLSLSSFFQLLYDLSQRILQCRRSRLLLGETFPSEIALADRTVQTLGMQLSTMVATILRLSCTCQPSEKLACFVSLQLFFSLQIFLNCALLRLTSLLLRLQCQ